MFNFKFLHIILVKLPKKDFKFKHFIFNLPKSSIFFFFAVNGDRFYAKNKECLHLELEKFHQYPLNLNFIILHIIFSNVFDVDIVLFW